MKVTINSNKLHLHNVRIHKKILLKSVHKEFIKNPKVPL